MSVMVHRLELPWNTLHWEDRQFRWLQLGLLSAALLLGWVVSVVELSQPERIKRVQPPRLAKLTLERRPVELVKHKPPEIEIPEAKPKPVVKPKPRSKPKPKRVAKKRPKAPPARVAKRRVQSDPAAARRKAQQSGLLAFADELADLRSAPAVSSTTATRSLSKAGNQAKKVARSLVTADAARGSAGIDTSRLSRDTGGQGLSGRKTTQLRSAVQGNGGGGSRASRPISNSLEGQRSSEEVQLVFDRNKGAVYAIYNRALRKDPTLRGKLLLEITIAPSGRVTDCRLLSSELNNPSLERKLLARIRMFDFGVKDVATTVVFYPIDFLPS
ncbi:AgmX/PglI C-terminal domain-containing protein [endosymbiont of Ridgeia piscesae]|jgi:outer membrane biosynthesis protein TonB|uniref:Outer membrane transport energization protein TonB n=1 Tax=endosymbiont of Ridgeia piscesae TaxID=54398 RepID=A0A0T5Z9K9_9GAMM|nr:AgmX/PglI C-terminal domain-containing protein [endosymbiont of Ridgeia piscesae]KRT54531.1 outer membrane transport energization protein TonB [endosymbiont of Ridgeia piscesae]KRT59471.1 outer membrane transport energization protein TonB [endosymbiont of Ridgeia piscesae]